MGACLLTQPVYAGQQDVVINDRPSASFSFSSSASLAAVISAPKATSITASKPICLMPARICPGVALNCP